MPEPPNSISGVDIARIEALLSAAPVTLAVLYGSRARGEATARSDIDIAVVFEDDLSSVERTRARLSLVEKLQTLFDTDRVDVTPLANAPPSLRREIRDDGIVLLGSQAALESFDDGQAGSRTHEERVTAFDELLADIERVV